MGHKAFQKDLNRFDLWAFCQSKESLSSIDVQLRFPRLEAEPSIESVVSLDWRIEGGLNRRRESTVQINGTMSLRLHCSQCGELVAYNINLGRTLVLLASEQLAESYDEGELGELEDVVACGDYVCLADWLEDEMLLSLPMLPKHDACSGSTLASDDSISDSEQVSSQDTHKPFANLGHLIKKNKH